MSHPMSCNRHRSGPFSTRILASVCAGVILVSGPTPAKPATLVNTFSDWTLYSNEDGGGKVCFLAAVPAQTQPAGLARAAAVAFISAWPKDGVKSEISFKIGFPVKKATEPIAGVIGQIASSYKLFVKDDRAFVADATQELKLLDALKKGSKLTVQATSGDGTTVIDTYSLQGFTAGLQALAAGCR